MKHLVPTEVLTRRQNLRYLESLRSLARSGRSRSTRTEDILWYEILNKRKLGHKFTRQKPLGRFVADFYCSELLLIVEIDGGYHLNNKYHDDERDKYFSSLKIFTMRIKTYEILNSLDIVKSELLKIVKEREVLLNCSPSSRGGGRRPEGF